MTQGTPQKTPHACKKCLIEKVLEDDFHIAGNTKTGRHSVCKTCRSEYMRAYHANKKPKEAKPSQPAFSGTE